MAKQAKNGNGEIYNANSTNLNYNATYYCCNPECKIEMKLKNYNATNNNIWKIYK